MSARTRRTPDQPPCLSQCHDGDTAPPPIAVGLELCSGCRDQAEENLVELPELYEMCAYMLDLRQPQPRERVRGHRSQGIVLHEVVVTIRTDILGVLASWCGLVRSERGVTGPDELTVRHLSAFVHIHFTWLSQHPAAAEFADELAQLAVAARNVLKPNTDTLFDLGPCTRPGCGETVRAEGQPPTLVRCDSGHEWAPEQWLLLRGDPAGYPNGHANGHANGRNGHANGHANGNHNGNGHPMNSSTEGAE